jgi:phosphohistidine phosphatase
MNRLYLLRHGIAVPFGTPGIDDDDRPLTPKGEKRMRQIARGLNKLDLKLDRIVSSPVPRALRTAELVADVLELKGHLETDEALRPGNSAASIRDWLKERAEARLMIVGHDPAFSELVGLLATGEPRLSVAELKKGGVAAFCAEPEGELKLDWLAPPKLIRRLAR